MTEALTNPYAVAALPLDRPQRSVRALWLVLGPDTRTQARTMIRLLESESSFDVRFGVWFARDGKVLHPPDLEAFDVIIHEGGWSGREYSAFEEDILPWVRRGGQYVLLDVARRRLAVQSAGAEVARESYQWLSRVIGAGPRFMWAQEQRDPAELANVRDKTGPAIEALPEPLRPQQIQGMQRQANRHEVREGDDFYMVDPADFYGYEPIEVQARTMKAVDGEWGPALRRVDTLLISDPVELEVVSRGWAVADLPGAVTCAANLSVPGYDHTWASVCAAEFGYVALVAASFSADRLVNRSPGNALWLGDLIRLMIARTEENQRWSAVSREPTFDAGLGRRAKLGQEESERLERKSVPQDNGSGIDVFNVAKSVAALANKDGGHVLVGQRDDGTFVDLQELIGSIGAPDADKFVNNLIGKLDAVFDPNFKALGVKIEWVIVIAGSDSPRVLILDVPRATQPVYLRLKKGSSDWAFFVRHGNRTDRLSGSGITDYARDRFPGRPST